MVSTFLAGCVQAFIAFGLARLAVRFRGRRNAALSTLELEAAAWRSRADAEWRTYFQRRASFPMGLGAKMMFFANEFIATTAKDFPHVARVHEDVRLKTIIGVICNTGLHSEEELTKAIAFLKYASTHEPPTEMTSRDHRD
jgi:hypothetical protein